MNFGNTDAANLTPAATPVQAGNNSYEKWFRMHVTAMGGSNVVDNIRVWKSVGAYVTEEGIQTNLKTSGYSAASYATPSTTTFTDQAMPTSEPGSANIGIGGALNGTIVAPGYSDYIIMQRQTGSNSPAGNANTLTITIKYDEA